MGRGGLGISRKGSLGRRGGAVCPGNIYTYEFSCRPYSVETMMMKTDHRGQVRFDTDKSEPGDVPRLPPRPKSGRTQPLKN